MASFMQRKRDELRARGIDPDRLPPGQYVTERFPVLHLGTVPDPRPLAEWTLAVGGDGVGRPRRFTWSELHALPTRELIADIHCVTKWSKLDVTWRGVSLHEVLAMCSPRPDAVTFVARGEHEYSASISWQELRDHDAMLAWEVDGAALEPEHGYPLRLVVPHLYFWKSVKWLRGIELWSGERHGFWEEHGYHRHGDPFAQERYWGDDSAPESTSGAASGDDSALSRPLATMLERAITTPTDDLVDDVEQLREACRVVLQRVLDRPGAAWEELVDTAAVRWGWDRWRHGGLLAASDPTPDLAMEATRELLAEFAEELRSTGGAGKSHDAAETPEVLEGRRRRELIFSVERALDLIGDTDADGLQKLAASIAERDSTGELSGLPEALRMAADDLHSASRLQPATRDRLVQATDSTPFAAAMRTLPTLDDPGGHR